MSRMKRRNYRGESMRDGEHGKKCPTIRALEEGGIDDGFQED